MVTTSTAFLITIGLSTAHTLAFAGAPQTSTSQQERARVVMKVHCGACHYPFPVAARFLIRDNRTPVDTAEAFEESINGCYPETTTVGWPELDTVTVLKQIDP